MNDLLIFGYAFAVAHSQKLLHEKNHPANNFIAYFIFSELRLKRIIKFCRKKNA
jgi:hypothetical protein